MKYSTPTIIFSAIVDNKSTSQPCLLPEDAYKVFTDFELDYAPCERLGMFDNIDSLCEAFKHEHDVIASGSIQHEEEGSLLYAIRRGTSNDQVISVTHLKNLEYQVFEKLRDRLRKFWNKYEYVETFDSYQEKEYDNVFNNLLSEIKSMEKTAKMPNSIAFYERFMNHAFTIVQNDLKTYELLRSFYSDFLKSV